MERLRYNQEEKLADSPLTKPRIFLGSFYIVFAFGILFNWFTYFLIIVLDPLPDRFIFNYIEFAGIDLEAFLENCTIIGNTMYDNGQDGIVLRQDCDNNTIRENLIYRSGYSGILLQGGSDHNIVKK
ncbi:unnamed protein product, partial [marine sediment metagenome]